MTNKYYVSGIHCSACVLLIEKKLTKIKGVRSANVSLSDKSVIINTSIAPLAVNFLNKLFINDGYTFSVSTTKSAHTFVDQPDFFVSLTVVLLVAIFFYVVSKSGFSTLVSVGAKSTLPLFFIFGLVAGASSCAALVGGIVLSLSKQWLKFYGDQDSVVKKLQPHFLFNFGRVAGYTFFGAILGQVGNFFRLSPVLSASLVIAVSLLMLILGLQMIGVKSLANFQIKLPQKITSRFADEANFTSRFAPLIMGALTFFLPCGFTITAQALALASGDPIRGAAIMGLFALGTVPGLLVISFGSVKFFTNHKLANQFSQIAGLLVLLFALFSINSQLSVLGFANLNSVTIAPTEQSATLPPLINGVQVVKISASSSGYFPNIIILRPFTPTRWEVTATNISGCTNAIIARSLFDGRIDLVNGTVSIKEFTSPGVGTYRFSCWMGMVSGVVEVIN